MAMCILYMLFLENIHGNALVGQFVKKTTGKLVKLETGPLQGVW